MFPSIKAESNLCSATSRSLDDEAAKTTPADFPSVPLEASLIRRSSEGDLRALTASHAT